MAVTRDKESKLFNGIAQNIAKQLEEHPEGGFLFTDLQSSTAICDLMGDEKFASKVQQPYFELAKGIINTNNGYCINTVGDSVLAFFPLNAKSALNAAISLQNEVCNKLRDGNEQPIGHRVALHYGEVQVSLSPAVDTDGQHASIFNISGMGINLLARILSATKPQQILLSADFEAKINKDHKWPLFDWGTYLAWGISRDFRIFEFLWDGAPKTLPESAKCRPIYRFNPYLSPFIGREPQLSSLQAMLTSRESRAIVVKGPGGMGKTRLAYKACELLYKNGAYIDGVFFVKLGDVTASYETWVGEMFRAFKVESPEVATQPKLLLTKIIGNRDILIVLDNLEGEESLREESGRSTFCELIDGVLLECPNLQVLCISQSPAPVSGWRNFDLENMDIPSEGAGYAETIETESFKLFKDNADRIKKGWSLQERDCEFMRDLLRLTGGLPLVIEMVASHVDIRSLRRMRDDLTNKVSQLEKGSGSNVPQRHITMSECYEYSCGLLDDKTRDALLRLSVFAMSFDTDAAEKVAYIPQEQLDTLVRKCFLRFDAQGERYRFDHVLGLYLKEKMEKTDGGRKFDEFSVRHAVYYAMLLQRNHKLYHEGDAQGDKLSQIKRARNAVRNEYANIFLFVKQVFAKKLIKLICFSDYLSVFLMADNQFFSNLCLRVESEKLARLSDEKYRHAMTLNNLGNAYINLPTGNIMHNLRKAIECYECVLKIFTEIDYPQQWAGTMSNLCNAYVGLFSDDNNIRKAIVYCKCALRIFDEKKSSEDWGGAMNNLGNAYLKLKIEPRVRFLKIAVECYEGALKVYTKFGSPYEWARTMCNLGVACSQIADEIVKASIGDKEDCTKFREKAKECLEKSLEVFSESNFSRDWARANCNLAIVYCRLPAVSKTENLNRSIECCDYALKVRTEHYFPQEWATTLLNKAIAYRELGLLAKNLDHLNTALSLLEDAKRGYSSCGLFDDVQKVEEIIRRIHAELDEFLEE